MWANLGNFLSIWKLIFIYGNNSLATTTNFATTYIFCEEKNVVVYNTCC